MLDVGLLAFIRGLTFLKTTEDVSTALENYSRRDIYLPKPNNYPLVIDDHHSKDCLSISEMNVHLKKSNIHTRKTNPAI